MISPELWLDTLKTEGIDFIAGVPDSLLKNFLQVVSTSVGPNEHVICANEGNAVAMACGHQMSTGRIPLVYMQNSGLGNAVNPLTSLADRDVYSIPLVLMIGWRGKPGEHDEPQHLPMGRVTPEILQALNIPFEIMSDDFEVARTQLVMLLATATEFGSAVALLVPANTFDKPGLGFPKNGAQSEISREDAVAGVTQKLTANDAVFASTGFIGRQLLACRGGNDGTSDFLNVGAMGHTSQIALGMALGNPHKRVICLDGDGSVLMHLGALATNAKWRPANFKHIVLNNGMHESVGGQPTAAAAVDISELARVAGYPNVERCVSLAQLPAAIQKCLESELMAFLEIVIAPSDDKLPRPGDSLVALKGAFMNVHRRLSDEGSGHNS